MAILVSSQNGTNKSGTEDSAHTSSHTNNNNTKEGIKNMSDMNNTIPFSIPVGMGNCWGHDKSDVWNNPFMYIILLALFGQNGFGGFGGRGFPGMTPAGAEIAGNINSSVDDARSKIAEVKGIVEAGKCDLTGIESTLGQLGLRVDSVKDTVLGALNSLDKTVMQGNFDIASKICDCCCSTKQAIANAAYETNSKICSVEKEILRQTADISQGLANLGFLVERNNGQVVNAITSAQAQIGFNQERNTAQIVQAITSEGSATRQLMTQFHNEDLLLQKQTVIDDLTRRNEGLARDAQTAYLLSQLKPTTTAAAA